MSIPSVLALSLEEASRRLTEAGFEHEVEVLLPPRDREEDFAGQAARKYVVRQQVLSCNKILLTVVYRV